MHHLSLIWTMAQTGNYSSLSTSLYTSSSVSPVLSSRFHPAAFHALCATVISMTGAPTAMAENAFVAVVMFVIYPVGVFQLLRKISGQKTVVLGGAFACLQICAFPWRLISWGPLFPYMLSMALVPLGFIVFVRALRSLLARSRRACAAAQCLVTLLAVFLAHPSGVFLMGIFLMFYIAQWIYLRVCPNNRNAASSHAHRLRPMLLFLAACAVLWTIAFKLPMLQGLVSFNWKSTSTFSNALWALISLRLTDDNGQVIMPIILILGIWCAGTNKRRYAWLLALAGFTAIQFLVSFVAGAPMKHFLCGFWYTDQHRIAANYGLAIVPLCALGFGRILEQLQNRFAKGNEARQAKFLGASGAVACAVLFFAALLTPTQGVVSSWQIPMSTTSHSLPTDATIDSASLIDMKYDVNAEKSYDEDEKEFVDEALKTIDDGALVINIPNDGSCFSYALQRMNVYYHSVVLATGDSGNETQDSKVIRTKLNHISTDSEVQKAVADTGAKYVLILDKNTMEPGGANILPPYEERVWEGIYSIEDSTPGFTTVLSRGDMRLYMINSTYTH